MRVLALATVLAAAMSCADEPRSDHQPDASARRVEPVGFDLVEVSVETAAGDVVELTVWMASSSDERSRGLTGVTDLGNASGMIFLFDDEREYRFHMSQTPMPLDIAFFDADGDHVGSAGMEPCLDQAPSRCERYSPGVPFRAAIELPAGTLDHLGIGEGSSLRTA